MNLKESELRRRKQIPEGEVRKLIKEALTDAIKRQICPGGIENYADYLVDEWLDTH